MNIEDNLIVIRNKIKVGDFAGADTLCDALLSFHPQNKELMEVQRSIHNELTLNKFPGPTYLEWLKWFHSTFHPKNYLEIGVESGQSLQFANADTHSVGIDPAPKIVHGFDAWAKIFKTTSDDFFSNHNVKDCEGVNEFGTGCINFSFIDGLHYYDQVLRDFINVEKSSNKNTIIAMHDVFPAIPATATRAWNTVYWAGDTWKIMPILAKYRPDLKLYTIPTFPTGLGVVFNLDPTSTVLSDNIDMIIKEFADDTYDISKPINLINNNFSVVSKLLGDK
jgi:hypothetical protein